MKKILIIMVALVGGIYFTATYASANSHHYKSYGYIPYPTGNNLSNCYRGYRGPSPDDWPYLKSEDPVERFFGRGPLRGPCSMSSIIRNITKRWLDGRHR